MSDIQQRRADLQNKLDALKQEAGRAALDGERFNKTGEITRIERALESLDTAEGIASDRNRETNEAARLAKAAEIRTEMAGKLEAYLEAVESAEHAARDYLANLKEALRLNREMARDAGRLNDHKKAPLPSALQPVEIVRRLSGRLAAILRLWEGRPHGRHFGFIEWQPVSLFSAEDDWREKEAKLLRGQLANLLGDAQPKRENQLLIENQKETKDDAEEQRSSGPAG